MPQLVITTENSTTIANILDRLKGLAVTIELSPDRPGPRAAESNDTQVLPASASRRNHAQPPRVVISAGRGVNVERELGTAIRPESVRIVRDYILRASLPVTIEQIAADTGLSRSTVMNAKTILTKKHLITSSPATQQQDERRARR